MNLLFCLMMMMMMIVVIKVCVFGCSLYKKEVDDYRVVAVVVKGRFLWGEKVGGCVCGEGGRWRGRGREGGKKKKKERKNYKRGGFFFPPQSGGKTTKLFCQPIFRLL